MESFVRVVRSGSFTIAANQLGLSRALVSRHVGDLEQRLGVRLLNRSTRSLNLTDEGRAYLEFCEKVFQDMEANERAIVRAKVEPAGTIKINAPKSFGSLNLGDAVVAFAQVQPRLRVSLRLDDVAFRKPYEFVERGLDVALRISSLRTSSLTEQFIAPVEWVICASPAYLSDNGRPNRPEELADHPCLIHASVTPNDRIWRFETKRGEAPLTVKVTGVFFSNSAMALRKATLADLGITLLPRYAVADDLAKGTLTQILARYKLPSRPLYAVYPRAASVPQKINVFVDFLRNWVEGHSINDGILGR